MSHYERERDALLYAVSQHSTVIVTCPPAERALAELMVEGGFASGERCVCCVSPSRSHAVNDAKVSSESGGAKLGGAVGYAVRLNEMWDPRSTRLLFTNDEWLLRASLFDPLLAHFSVVVVNVEESGVGTELLLGLLKKISISTSGTLRLVVTGDAYGKLSSFFEDSIVVDSPFRHRAYPVDIFYSEEPMGSDYVAEAARVVSRIHAEEQAGDVLVFMPGGREVDECVELVHDSLRGACEVIPLYASVDPETKRRAATPSSSRRRRVVVATDNNSSDREVAAGIRYVVDPGFVRLALFDAEAGSEFAVTTMTSRAQASRRAESCARRQHGKCYRLYTETVKMVDSLPSALERSDLTWPLLQLKAVGVDNVLDFDLPCGRLPTASLIAALDELRALGALDDRADLVQPLGERLALAPVEPRLARALLASIDLECSTEVAEAAAVVIQRRSLRLSRSRDPSITKRFRDDLVHLDGDHATYVKTVRAYEAFARHKGNDTARWCKDRGLEESVLYRARPTSRFLIDKWLKPIANAEQKHISSLYDHDRDGGETTGWSDALRRCFVAGFFARAAKLAPDGTYRSLKATKKRESSSSSLRLDSASIYSDFGTPPDVVCFCDYKLDDQFDLVASHVARVHPNMLLDAGDSYYKRVN